MNKFTFRFLAPLICAEIVTLKTSGGSPLACAAILVIVFWAWFCGFDEGIETTKQKIRKGELL